MVNSLYFRQYFTHQKSRGRFFHPTLLLVALLRRKYFVSTLNDRCCEEGCSCLRWFTGCGHGMSFSLIPPTGKTCEYLFSWAWEAEPPMPMKTSIHKSCPRSFLFVILFVRPSRSMIWEGLCGIPVSLGLCRMSTLSCKGPGCPAWSARRPQNLV